MNEWYELNKNKRSLFFSTYCCHVLYLAQSRLYATSPWVFSLDPQLSWHSNRIVGGSPSANKTVWSSRLVREPFVTFTRNSYSIFCKKKYEEMSTCTPKYDIKTRWAWVFRTSLFIGYYNNLKRIQ